MMLESLERREMLSAAPTGLTPAQVRHVYGFDQVTFRHKHRNVPGDGRGQTIAIVTAYDAPNIKHDLDVFSQTFGLPTTDAYGEPTLSKVIHRSQPRADAGWALEASLDVEWAHAIAPKAHILLVEAASPSTSDLLTAVDYARSQPGVVAVSMSWGGHESPFDQYHDDYLSTPAGHVGGYGMEGGVTFISASGDNGEPASWPATSTHVVAVGGTTLTVGRKSRYRGESAWSGSGGGVSYYQGTYAPDVAYDADPQSGFSVYDTTQGVGWQTVGGTSAGCPQWAALFAIVDEGRELSGLPSLDGPSETLDAIYATRARNFNDITTGANDNYAAQAGYDLVTGRGTPIAYRLIPALAGYQPAATTAGVSRSVASSAVTAPAVASLAMVRHESRMAGLFGKQEIL
ncbi:MAG TPA: S53 family peptidase [Tepidisphaeraceae bacterium]|jgi:subtilase family serine protease